MRGRLCGFFQTVSSYKNGAQRLGGVGKQQPSSKSSPVHRCCPRSSPLRPPPQRGETPHHPAALRSMAPDLVVLMPTEHP